MQVSYYGSCAAWLSHSSCSIVKLCTELLPFLSFIFLAIHTLFSAYYITAGTFENPTQGIPVLASILQQLHSNNPNLIISLNTQPPNIAASPDFSTCWANYASLISKVY